MATNGRGTVLVVDDDPVARRLIRASVQPDGYHVIEAEDAETGANIIENERPDLLILDVELPGMSGFELLARMSHELSVPVIVLSARVSESDRVLGLDLGAADYVVKPFLPRELAARVRSLLRRAAASVEGTLSYGDLVIRLAEREVTLRGELIHLTTREFDLLAYLAARPRKVVTRKELLEQVWNSREDWQDPATVTEHVRRVRRKLEDDPDQPKWLQTARGVGYRFVPEE